MESDLALNYDRLGEVYTLTQDDANAERSYRQALRLDPRLVSSRLGLAKIYQRQGKYAQALSEIDVAAKVDPERPDVHYLRGRTSAAMGHKEESKREWAEVKRIENTVGEKTESGTVPSPELLQESPQ